jgi:predicted phosphodiesterase
MRVAALYDIHGNLPALEAVLAEVEAAAPDLVIVGGDVVAGPLPAETLERLVALGDRVRWVMGNADRKVVEAYDRGGRPQDPEDAIDRLDAWVARHLTRAQRDRLAAFEPLVRAEVDGLGPVLFCHGSPRSDEEIITAVSPDERLAPMLDGVSERVVVCGHTHHQFDRRVHATRVLNAGSVGRPYEDEPAAYWLWLGPGAELRRTAYDIASAARRLEALAKA